MTEDEAKTKWCPFARVISRNGSDETAANRWPDDPESPAGTTNCCIGSACMAFRWLPDVVARPNLTERAHSGRMGFCGLAGAP
jgi:hypothetical protein